MSKIGWVICSLGAPDELPDLVAYFSSTYVSGNLWTIQIPGGGH